MENIMKTGTDRHNERNSETFDRGTERKPCRPVNIIRQFPERPGEWRNKDKTTETEIDDAANRSSIEPKGSILCENPARAGVCGTREKSVPSGGCKSTIRAATAAHINVRLTQEYGRDFFAADTTTDADAQNGKSEGSGRRQKPVTLRKRMLRALYRTFCLTPYAKKTAKEQMKLRIVGKENLKNLRRGVIVLNNSDSRGALAVLCALGRKRFKLAYGAEQLPTSVCNRLGKAGMLLPMGATAGEKANFEGKVGYCAENDVFLLFHPEKTFVRNCERPRPFSLHAFTCAHDHRLDVVPMFMTYQPSGNRDDNGEEIQYVTLFVSAPISAASGVTAESMRDKAFEAFQRVYEQYYGKNTD